MRYNWFPWKFIVKKLARRHGFLDPLTILAQMQRFAQPSEVGEPVELLRAGMIFHARGLMNVRAIQHNLDWIWPYWVQRQFDPADESFIPRAFSFSHVNLTHRNWTAVGLPDCPILPVVDPRGLVTPYYDGWSLDFWIATEKGLVLVPSKKRRARQTLQLEPTVQVVTQTTQDGFELEVTTDLIWEKDEPVCRTKVRARAPEKAFLVAAVRPYNPEGVNFIHQLEFTEDRRRIRINGEHDVVLGRAADRIALSDYQEGDISNHLFERPEVPKARCDVGMATAAAVYAIDPSSEEILEVFVPLGTDEEIKRGPSYPLPPPPAWEEVMSETCRMQIPDERIQFLYDAAVRTLVLHSPRDVFPGPYTYKRFWFRDAAFMINALVGCGMERQAERALDQFAHRQMPTGYFLSQEGEWDSNGEAIWIYHRYCEVTGHLPKPEWLKAVRSGARWITRKRLPADAGEKHGGLLPAGFSAEHLGPNDFYYWDDFWGVAGLRAAADLMAEEGETEVAATFRKDAENFMEAIEKSVSSTRSFHRRGAIPAAPYRRMDAGAIGSIVADYPLQLWEAGDSRILATARFLRENCFFKGAFFQDMIHSGINAYLTLHLAQVFLRAGQPADAIELIEAVAAVASPTGQWPEAIHPRVEGGCMGDGQHAWAAAEWVLAIRNLFVREELDELILLAGVPEKWLSADAVARLGPAPTRWGPVSVSVQLEGETARVRLSARWRREDFRVRVALPGFRSVSVTPLEQEVVLQREGATA
jgi:hypothetical protein